VVRGYGANSNLDLIDRKFGVSFPRVSMSAVNLRRNKERLCDSDMPQDVKKRYVFLFDLVLQKRYEMAQI
jgi:hypothetical protein